MDRVFVVGSLLSVILTMLANFGCGRAKEMNPWQKKTKENQVSLTAEQSKEVYEDIHLHATDEATEISCVVSPNNYYSCSRSLSQETSEKVYQLLPGDSERAYGDIRERSGFAKCIKLSEPDGTETLGCYFGKKEDFQ